MPPEVTLIPFPGFNPDGAEHGLDGLARADNALPLYGGWYGWPDTGTSANLAGGPVLGSYCHTWPANVGVGSYSPDAITEFHGTEAALYTYDPVLDAWTAVTRGAGPYALGALVPAAWRFASWGNDVWAVNGVDVMQRRVNNAGAFTNSVTSTFVPVPRYLAPLREFMIAAHLNQVGRFVDEFAWSDADDPNNYDPATGTGTSLAGSKRIVTRRGAITGIVGGEYAVIFKRRSMHALQLTGGKDIFRLDEISGSIGCPYPGSIVEGSDGYIYFRGMGGFYRQAGLQPPELIPGAAWVTGDLRFSPFAISETVPTTMWREDLRVIGAESPSTGLIFWFWKSRAGGTQDDDQKFTGISFDTRTLRWGGLLRTSDPERFSTICSRPVNDQADLSLLWDVVATRGGLGGGTTAQRSSFHGTNAHAANFSTRKFSLSMDDVNRGKPRRITGIMPLLGTGSNTSYTGPGLLPIPTGTQVKVHRSNDPTFTTVLDADGGLVSPTTDTTDTTQLDEFGYFPNTLEGRWFVLEVVLPLNAGYRSVPGAYVRHEPVL